MNSKSTCCANTKVQTLTLPRLPGSVDTPAHSAAAATAAAATAAAAAAATPPALNFLRVDNPAHSAAAAAATAAVVGSYLASACDVVGIRTRGVGRSRSGRGGGGGHAAYSAMHLGGDWYV